MDSSRIGPNKSQLLIGGMGTNPKPYGVSSSTHGKPGLKREYENGDASKLSIKKSKTKISSDPLNLNNDREIEIFDPKPLSVREPYTPKLSRQFWKAGDDEEDEPLPRYCNNDAAVRVHPQFLHANATSHKWALGALAELLDNSLDEVCNGATYVHVDAQTNQRDKNSNILIIEDNGGGMNPSRFRECLSLGYSRKRNMANKIGQYGNGFKTSSMRLGADAIVFTRCRGTNGNNATESIGMLSYTFLYETRKCEAIVPTVDFELVDDEWKEIVYNNSRDEFYDNLDTIEKWSPFLSRKDLFDQFDYLEEQGTRIVIYNLWEDDEGKLELDFDTDPHDIQLRGVNRDEKNIDMAKAYPNSRHFLTYRHSLRSYASILYLKLPSNFRMILRGKVVEHHNLVDDMMLTEDIKYRPMRAPELSPDPDMVAALTLGFVKDARHHIDIQGFNVYHKNRLIKPFWRVWNAAGSDGRGVIGVLEANFIQPAHNKQGFERTSVLAKLENRLITYQKTYWSNKCDKIGYAPRRKQKNQESSVPETTGQRDQKPHVPLNHHEKGSSSNSNSAAAAPSRQNGYEPFRKSQNPQDDTQESDIDIKPVIGLKNGKPGLGISINETGTTNPAAAELQKVKAESAKQVAELQRQKALLELQVKQSKAEIQELEKAQNSVMAIFQEERTRRDVTEDNLRNKLQGATDEIDKLIRKVTSLEEDQAYCKKRHMHIR